MPYDYTKEYLERYEEIVKQLLTVYKDGTQLQMETTDHLDLVHKQRIVNNLLSSLALNFPEYADVRERMRTWTKFNNGTWFLYVGVPTGRILGSKPKVRTFLTQNVNVSKAPTTYEHDGLLTSPEAVEKFVGRVLELSPAVREAIAYVPPGSADDAGVAYLSGFFAESGWNVVATDDHTFTVTRA